MDGKEIAKLVLKSVDEKQLVINAIETLVEPALKKIVADSTNPFDDALFNLVFPQLKAFMVEEVEKLVAKIEA